MYRTDSRSSRPRTRSVSPPAPSSGALDAVLAANASGVLVGVSSFKGIKGRTDERAALWTPAAALRR